MGGKWGGEEGVGMGGVGKSGSRMGWGEGGGVGGRMMWSRKSRGLRGRSVEVGGVSRGIREGGSDQAGKEGEGR